VKIGDLLKVCGTAIGVCLAMSGAEAKGGVVGFSVVQIADFTMTDPPWPVRIARGVSPDGAVIVGFGSGGAAPGFRWTRAVQSLAIDVCPGASDASAGGAVVVGYGSGAILDNQARRWTLLGGVEVLEASGQDQSTVSAQGVSDDGAVIVGQMLINDGNFRTSGFVWESNLTGALALDPLPGVTECDAHAISGDGNWIGGVSAAFLPGIQLVRPFEVFDPASVCTVWPNSAPYTPEALVIGGARGMPKEVPLPGRVIKLNTDGSVAVGGTFGAPGVVAFIHHRPSGTTLVPGHPDGFGQTEALGVSADGRRAAGAFDGGAFGQGAWFWDARGGVFDLYELLDERGALPPGLLAILQATDLSADGTVIAAFGVRDLVFVDEPLEITIPAPCQGDANGDFIVDFDDLVSVLANWLNDYSPFPGTGPGDANLDGVVDFDDLVSVLGFWLTSCGGPQK